MAARLSSACSLRTIAGGALLAALAMSGSRSEAVTIRYDVVPLGGQTYQYVYTVENDGAPGAAPVRLFDVSFDPDLYETVSLTQTTPAPLSNAWSQDFLSAVPGVAAAYDVSATGGGVGVGQVASGFSVRFLWLGEGLPGAQPFEIYDPTTFARIGQGVTVPAPLTPWLVVSGATALLARRRARRASGRR